MLQCIIRVRSLGTGILIPKEDQPEPQPCISWSLPNSYHSHPALTTNYSLGHVVEYNKMGTNPEQLDYECHKTIPIYWVLLILHKINLIPPTIHSTTAQNAAASELNPISMVARLERSWRRKWSHKLLNGRLLLPHFRPTGRHLKTPHIMVFRLGLELGSTFWQLCSYGTITYRLIWIWWIVLLSTPPPVGVQSILPGQHSTRQVIYEL